MIGIIGGSGLENMKIMKNTEEVEIETPYGSTSSPITLGKISGVKVAIISRHGKKHGIMPGKVNYRANIWALGEKGVRKILATTACGSLREEIIPGQFIFPNQFIDWTKNRESTFFDKNEVCHIPMADPFCAGLRKVLSEKARELKLAYHEEGTLVTIEGPRFSTRAESNMFRQLGGDIINMSTVPEAVLAREAGMCYQPIAMATDFDCWRKSESVNISKVLDIFSKNVESVKKLIVASIPKIDLGKCICEKFIENAVIRK